MPQSRPCFLSLKNLRKGKMEESSEHRRRSRHKPRHHNESGETPKNP